ncbi:MAG TPA: HD domain-containing protein [Gemmatimonadaceae bacterium]|nr:HD domain-containing protein [Gemmatimonadaceae bacterium]
MTRLAIPTLSPGDRVQHELLVYDRTERKTNAGDPFVVLTLGNATGRIETAPIWSNQLEWAEGARSGKIVQVVGDVSLYGRNGVGKKQLSLTAPVRVLPDERFTAREFLPSIETDPQALWNLIDGFRAKIESQTLRRVLDLFFADDAFRVQFEQTPGSTQGHHARLGGLLQHTWEVANIARQTARTMGRRINHDLVIVGALLHDVGKVEAYEVGPGGFTYTPCGLLVGHVVLGTLMLERRLARIATDVCTPGQLLELQHMILSHHGSLEFGSPVVPMTAEAEIVHRADEASAKATDFLETLDDAELFAGGKEYTDRSVWRLGRRVWKRPHGWE